MKTLMLIAVLILTSFLYSCELPDDIPDPETDCHGKGTLSIENKSLHTVQQIIIDNTNYGTLDPGDKNEYSLAEGTHSLDINGISGGGGCYPSSVFIVECETEYMSCSY